MLFCFQHSHLESDYSQNKEDLFKNQKKKAEKKTDLFMDAVELQENLHEINHRH